jgi:hypothetical protein
MASLVEDPLQWRLVTPVKDVPYKSIPGARFKYDHYKGTGTYPILVHTDYIKDFLDEFLPRPKRHDDITVPEFAYWGKSGLAVVSVQIEGQDSGLPIDPWRDDLGAWEEPIGPNTYGHMLLVTLELGNPPQILPQPTPYPQPSPYLALHTWLDISAQSSGEFVHTPPMNTRMLDLDEDNEPDDDTEAAVRNPHIPATVLVPETTWTVKWRQIPEFIYVDKIAPRLDTALGTVNSTDIILRKYHPRETLLLVDFEQERFITWRNVMDGDICLIDLTLRFLQKEVHWQRRVYGHNSFWIPGSGWKYLLVDGRPTFDDTDFHNIFGPGI